MQWGLPGRLSLPLSAGHRRVGMTKAVMVRKCPVVIRCSWQESPGKRCKVPRLPSNYKCKRISLARSLETARGGEGSPAYTLLLLVAFGERTCGQFLHTRGFCWRHLDIQVGLPGSRLLPFPDTPVFPSQWSCRKKSWVCLKQSVGSRVSPVGVCFSDSVPNHARESSIESSG